MKFFTKNEVVGLILIFSVVFLLTGINMSVSLRRARDVQRKNDAGDIYNALERYARDFGVFPLSTSDGRIIACKGSDTKYDPKTKTLVGLVPCEWGKDPLRDPLDPSYPAYLNVIPSDPQTFKGVQYVYLSNGGIFQIYAYLEGKDEPEYNPSVIKRNLNCGNRICDFGLSYGGTPVDKSIIEEYENELMKESRNANVKTKK